MKKELRIEKVEELDPTRPNVIPRSYKTTPGCFRLKLIPKVNELIRKVNEIIDQLQSNQ